LGAEGGSTKKFKLWGVKIPPVDGNRGSPGVRGPGPETVWGCYLKDPNVPKKTRAGVKVSWQQIVTNGNRKTSPVRAGLSLRLRGKH